MQHLVDALERLAELGIDPSRMVLVRVKDMAGVLRAGSEALACKATGEAKTILFNLTGHGHFDMSSYERYFSGKLEDFDYPAAAVAASLAHLPKVG